MEIAWIGTGIMGSRMVRRLESAGVSVKAWSRPSEPEAEPRYGAFTRGADVVVTMVGTPADVQAVYFGEGGVLETASRSQLLVDMTTSSPTLAREIAAAASAVGAEALDAPVSGGPVGAESGSLSIMVGGQAHGVRRAAELFEPLARSVVHQGAPGSGQTAKLMNQLLVAAVTAATGEVFRLAQARSLNRDALLQSMLAGAAGSPLVEFIWDRLDAADNSPGYRLTHLSKDLSLLALEARGSEATPSHLDAPALQFLQDRVAHAIELFGSDVGSQTLGIAGEREHIG